jgi:hypothetical protein
LRSQSAVVEIAQAGKQFFVHIGQEYLVGGWSRLGASTPDLKSPIRPVTLDSLEALYEYGHRSIDIPAGIRVACTYLSWLEEHLMRID